LEHFQAKWRPVRRPEIRPTKKLERFHDFQKMKAARAFPGEVETGSPSGNATKQEDKALS
jgi:hypothetical protein